MNWYKKISSLILYHHTDIPPQVILQQGLRQGEGGLTSAGFWVEKEGWIPKGAVYLSKAPGQWPGKYVYAVVVDGLELLPDYPSFVDRGAYIDPKGYLYWENDEDVPNFLVDRYDEELGIDRDSITWEDSLAINGSVCTVGPIEPSRVKLMK